MGTKRKDRPWFKWWPADFMSDPVWLEADYVVGVYIKLLSLSWLSKHPGQILIHDRRPTYARLAKAINSEPERVQKVVRTLIGLGALRRNVKLVIESPRLMEAHAAYEDGIKYGPKAHVPPEGAP